MFGFKDLAPKYQLLSFPFLPQPIRHTIAPPKGAVIWDICPRFMPNSLPRERATDISWFPGRGERKISETPESFSVTSYELRINVLNSGVFVGMFSVLGGEPG